MLEKYILRTVPPQFDRHAALATESAWLSVLLLQLHI